MSTVVAFARHELRLGWRELIGMLTAGRPQRARIAIGVVLGFVAILHFVAWKITGPFAEVTFPPNGKTLMAVTGSAFLAWTIMISQAMESVTRSFYARSDLDLLLSSPAPTRSIFAIRLGAVGILTCSLAILLVGPFINALAFEGGPHWLAAYAVLLAMGAAATALATGMTIFLFHFLGPKRTRFISQVVAAIVGAVFVIGVQAFSILTYGNLSRIEAFQSDWAISWAPPLESVFWWPARAAMGDLSALAAVLVVCFFLFFLTVSVASRVFGRFALEAASVSMGSSEQKRRARFRGATASASLRRKEWTLLLRDPWLVSQTLMQILYLIPPALLLWRDYGDRSGGLLVIAPVLVMAAGQLAGGLAWLAISGEDAPELVATAPVTGKAVMRAKIEAVMSAIVLIVTPILLALAFASPRLALVTLGGVVAAAGSSTAIQMFFRAQAKRSSFRRRQTSSRFATFAEAFSSIGWAATAGLLAGGSNLAAVTVFAPLLVLVAASRVRPKQVAV